MYLIKFQHPSPIRLQVAFCLEKNCPTPSQWNMKQILLSGCFLYRRPQVKNCWMFFFLFRCFGTVHKESKLPLTDCIVIATPAGEHFSGLLKF